MPENMIGWAAVAARLARQAAGVRQAKIASELDVDQSTIARFERGASWPSGADRMLEAYAKVCGIDGGAIVLWTTAAELWARHRDGVAPPLDEFERELAAVARKLERAGRDNATGKRARSK